MRGHIRPARSEQGRQGRAWTLIYDAPAGEDGKRRQASTTIEGTRREADKELTRILREVDTHTFADPGRITVKEFLEKQFLSDWAPGNLAPQSLERYRTTMNLHIIPALGHHRLAKLAPAHIQSYTRQAEEDGKKRGKGGLSRSTTRLHVQILHKAMALAIKQGLLVRNPCDGVELADKHDGDVPILTKEEALQLLVGARGDRLFVPICLALGWGLRRGEALAVQWKDLDWQAGTVTICRSMQQRGTFKAPKTRQGRRVLAMPAFLREALSMHQQEQSHTRALYGDTYQDHDLVCCLPDGRPMANTACGFIDSFHRLLRNLGLPDVTYHSLRHLHASLLLGNGESPKDVSQQLGHSDVRVTMSVYAHALPGAPGRLASRIDGFFGG